MARSRNIKPSFFTNDTLAECDPLARLLFVGLWTIADREGRLEDRPKKIKIEILPYDDCDIEILLKQLCGKIFIKRYRQGENSYIQILNFVKHQNPHVKEGASMIPAPDEHQTSPVQNVPLTESLLLIPESITPIPVQEPDKENLFKFEQESKKITSPEGFDTFWQVYPKQRIGNRDAALKAYAKALTRASADEILAGAKRYAKSDEVARKFAKGSAAWLNDDRWTSDYTAQPLPQPPRPVENRSGTPVKSRVNIL